MSLLCALLTCAVSLTQLAACGGAAPGADSPEWQGASTGGGRVEPTSNTERKVLAELDQLPPNTPKTVDGVTVVADAPYFSASGRTCRRLTITARGAASGASRLVCKDPAATDDRSNGNAGWFYAPDVFAPPAANP